MKKKASCVGMSVPCHFPPSRNCSIGVLLFVTIGHHPLPGVLRVNALEEGRDSSIGTGSDHLLCHCLLIGAIGEGVRPIQMVDSDTHAPAPTYVDFVVAPAGLIGINNKVLECFRRNCIAL